jgi:6-phosphofructokinase 2
MAEDILTVTLNPAIDVSADARMVRPIHKTRTGVQTFDPGGGGINVARTIMALGGKALALHLSDGITGPLLNRLLDESGLTHRQITTKAPTRIAFNVFEQDSGLEYRFVPEGAPVIPGEVETCLKAIGEFHGKYVVASGSLPQGADKDTYLRMSEIAARNGAKFILDTSGPVLHHTLENASVYLAKPSLRELGEIVGRELDASDAEKAALSIVERGKCEMLAITLGQQGAIFAHPGGVLRMPAIHVSTRSAVGAGDSFLGAMVWALANDWAPEQSFRLGVAAGAAAALTPGTQLCLRDDVFRLFEENADA